MRHERKPAVLADCPHKRLAVGKHRGWYLTECPINYQRWAQSQGYPDSLFERVKTDEQSMVEANENEMFDSFCRNNNI
jgi:hypothetical protein